MFINTTMHNLPGEPPYSHKNHHTNCMKQKTEISIFLKYNNNRFIPPILTWALTLSCKRDMGSLLCLITTRYGSFCTAPISSWNFWRDDCLITRVFAEIQKMEMPSVNQLIYIPNHLLHLQPLVLLISQYLLSLLNELFWLVKGEKAHN